MAVHIGLERADRADRPDPPTDTTVTTDSRVRRSLSNPPAPSAEIIDVVRSWEFDLVAVRPEHIGSGTANTELPAVTEYRPVDIRMVNEVA